MTTNNPPYIPRFGSGAPSGVAPKGTIYFDTAASFTAYIYDGGWQLISSSGSGGLTQSTGTWVPSLTTNGTHPTGVTYGLQIGQYIKTGNEIVVTFDMELSSKGTGGTGDALISGLPFSNSGISTFFIIGSSNYTLSLGYNIIYAAISASSNNIILGQLGSALAATSVSYSGLADTSEFFGSLIYKN